MVTNPDDINRKRFDYILARSRTRESSILAIASIAAGASLVLLGLYLQAQVDYELNVDHKSDTLANNKQVIQALGIFFAFLGFVYREFTTLTIHRYDEKWLKEQTQINKIDDKYKLTHTHDTQRSIILRILLWMPIPAWVYVIHSELSAKIFFAIVIGYIIAVYLIVERHAKQ